MVVLRPPLPDLPILIDSQAGKVKGKQVCIKFRGIVLIIKDTGVPCIIRGEYGMSVGTHIVISGFDHIHVGQASPNGEGDDMTFTGS
jgi:hypothetical protein